jgi:UDP-N-acetylglucosamine acyltransferase
MTKQIHATAVIHPNAIIQDGCIIGPFCVIGENVQLAKNVHLIANVYIDGDTHIDEGTIVYPYVVIGVAPQDLKYRGEPTKIRIGKNNKIRENSTVHLATLPEIGGTGVTQIGDNCLLMVNTHVAHDVIIGNNVIIANNVLLAGHVIIEDNVTIGGGSAIHQFCRIGEHSFIGGMSGVVADIVPYALYTGIREEGEINGINMIGLKRKGYTRDEMHAIADCYNLVFSKEDVVKNNIIKAKYKFKNNDKVMKVIEFITSEKSRHLCSNYKNRFKE